MKQSFNIYEVIRDDNISMYFSNENLARDYAFGCNLKNKTVYKIRVNK